LTRLAVGLAALTGAFALLAPGVAVAAPPVPAAAGVAAAPGGGGPAGIAAMALAPKSFTATYSCGLSAFGAGIAPVSVSATLSFPASVQVGRKLDITLKTASVTLPSAVLSQLTHVVSVGLSAPVTVHQGNDATVALKGKTPVSGTPAGLPASTATGSVLFTDPGTATVKVPARKLVFTPRTSASTSAGTSAGTATAPPAIICTTKTAATDVSVTVSPPAGTTGPLYECAVTAFGVTQKALGHIPMSITSSGSRKTGVTDTVTLVIPDFGPYPPGTRSVKFTSSLQVLGAQPGTIALSKMITDISARTARVPGKLALTKTGTDRILIPRKFIVTFDVSLNGVAVSFKISCAIHMSHVPVGLTIKVTKGHPRPQPSPTPTATDNGGQGQGSGTPTGAPDTGGGAAAGADLAVAAGGLAMVVSGGGLVLLGRRRRRGPAS
jgi:hypothetical protein